MTTPCISSPTAPIHAIVTADDGGVGKTTYAVQLATSYALAGWPIDLFQMDTKAKLGAKTGRPVVSLSVADRHAGYADELAPGDVIAPWYRALTDNPQTRRSTLLEVGGANAALFHEGILDFDLQEDIELLGLNVVAFVLVRSGEDAARQLLRELGRLEANLPGARAVIVRNEVSGCPVAASSLLEPVLRKAVLSALRRYPSLRMPRVNPRTMLVYERLHVTPDVVVSWHSADYTEAMRRTGLPRDEAKKVVRHVAAWSGIVQDEIARILPALLGGRDD